MAYNDFAEIYCLFAQSNQPLFPCRMKESFLVFGGVSTPLAIDEAPKLGSFLPMPEPETKNSRRKRVEEMLRECGSVLVALSGGVDSALLAAVAARVLGERAAAVTAVSPSLAPGELDDARAVTERAGIRHIEMPTDEIDHPDYAANTLERCFHCKTVAYGAFTEFARREGFAVVVDGANANDAGDYRPGRKAASDYGVRSPLAEAGMDKEEVREWARDLGLPVWDKPAAACLSSRIPYGSPVTREKLARIGAAELGLKRLGFRKSNPPDSQKRSNAAPKSPKSSRPPASPTSPWTLKGSDRGA